RSFYAGMAVFRIHSSPPLRADAGVTRRSRLIEHSTQFGLPLASLGDQREHCECRECKEDEVRGTDGRSEQARQAKHEHPYEAPGGRASQDPPSTPATDSRHSGAAENQRHYHADADRKQKPIWSNAGAKRIGKFALQIAVGRKPIGRVGGERGWQQEQYARNGHRDRSARWWDFVGFTHPPTPTQPLRRPSTLPATASSFLRSFLSRASGAVISALSSARSEPIGQASCSRGKSRASRATIRFALSALAWRTLMMSSTFNTSWSRCL